MTVTDITSKLKTIPKAPLTTAEQVALADAEIARVSRNPNEVLTRLLAAGCLVSFAGNETEDENGNDVPDGTTVTVTLPDYSFVYGHGPTPVHALVDAYAEGAWIADLPAALAIAAEAS